MTKFKKIDMQKIQTWTISLLVLLNIIAFVFVANKIYFRIDMTDGNKYSISKPTVELLKKLDNNMIIEYYYSDKCREHSRMAQVVQYVIDMLKEYESSSKGFLNLIIKELNYEKNREDIDELEKQGIQFVPLSEHQKGESKTLLGFSGIIIKYKGEQKVLPTIFQDIGFEYTLDSEIKKFVEKEKSNLGVIFALSSKSYDKDYKYVKQFTESEYENVGIIASGENIPDEISLLLIIGGNNLNDYDIFQIDQFLMKGGKAFIALNGLNVIINPQFGIFGMPNESKLFDLLAFYGIKINKDMIGDNESYTPLPQRQGFFVQEYRYPIWPSIKAQNFNEKHPIVEKLRKLSLFWVSSIEIDEKIKDKTRLLFHTTKESWSVRSDFKLTPDAYKYPIQKGEKEYNIAYSFKGKIKSYFEGKDIPKNENQSVSFIGNRLNSGESQLVVVGNEHFLWDNFISQDEQLFLLNSLDWLSKDNLLIQIRNKGKFSRPLYKAHNQTQYNHRKSAIIIITTFIIPLLFILLAIMLNFLRHLKNERLKLLFAKKK